MESEFPFRLRGDDGVIRVSITRNEEPTRWGWRLLGVRRGGLIDSQYVFPNALHGVGFGQFRRRQKLSHCVEGLGRVIGE